jgi:guanylate kinase
VLIITGPSGVGKGTLIQNLLREVPGLELSVSATTRKPRPGEQNGVDYWFLTPEEFEERLQNGEFLEHAEYAGNRYGTLRSEIERVREKGGDGEGPRGLVLEIEIQGARQVREALPEAVQVFVEPPSLEALRTRLIGRGSDDPETIERRLRVAQEELKAADEFKYRIKNDRLEDAVAALADLVATLWADKTEERTE